MKFFPRVSQTNRNEGNIRIDMLQKLPEEICQLILRTLDDESLINAAMISDGWMDICIHDPTLRVKIMKYSKFNNIIRKFNIKLKEVIDLGESLCFILLSQRDCFRALKECWIKYPKSLKDSIDSRRLLTEEEVKAIVNLINELEIVDTSKKPYAGVYVTIKLANREKSSGQEGLKYLSINYDIDDEDYVVFFAECLLNEM